MKSSIATLLLAALCACAQEHKKETSEAAPSESTSTNPSNTLPGKDPYQDPRAKIIKTADYRFRVENLRKSAANIEALTQKFPAHISNSNVTMEGSIIENKMTIRVQSEYFYDLLKEIDREAAQVHHRNISTEDVAKQFVDLESRLKTKRQVQERYENILRTKAGTVEELLSAEKQIGELQEEIEATVSRLSFLKDQVAYSTINLEFYERVVEQNIAEMEDSIWKKFSDAFMNGLAGAVNLMVGITTIWPLLIIGGIAFFILRKKKLITANKS